MAIKIYEQFAPFANPADGDYPLGSFKNDSIPGAEDGTPLDAVWANDYAGTDAELFAQAGIVPNGQPDKLGASQRVDALNKLYGNENVAYLSKLINKFGIAAWAQAVNYTNFIIDVNSTKSDTYVIPVGQNIVFAGARVTQAGNVPAFTCPNSSWSISGVGRIYHASGVKPTAKTVGQVGVSVQSTAFLWSIGGDISVMHFGDAGIRLDGAGLVTGFTGRNKISGLTCSENYDNYSFLSGFPAEYCTLSNTISTYATRYGVYMETGNITWNGGMICYNTHGVWLEHPTNGANPHHGMFVGTLINHNIETQLTAESVAAGYVFDGCMFYDNETPNKGMIDLNSSRGVSIINGTIGCNVQARNDGFAAHYGYNTIRNNRIDRSKSIITGVGFDRTKLMVANNYDFAGDWSFNDSAKVFALKRVAADKPLTGESSYSILIDGLDTVVSDNRNALVTGNFVAPWDGTYTTTVTVDIVLSVASTGTETVVVSRDDGASGTLTTLFAMKIPAGATSFNATVSLPFPVSKGGQLSSFLFGAAISTTYTVKAGSQIAFSQ